MLGYVSIASPFMWMDTKYFSMYNIFHVNSGMPNRLILRE